MYVLELLNQEGEDTFFTSKHGHEKIVRTNWERKQTLPPSEPAPLANARECCCQKVKAPTPKENTAATPSVADTVVVQQPPPTPPPVEPILDIEHANLTLIEEFMKWWTEANPGHTLLCEGSGMRQCNNPATHVKMHASFVNTCYPKCAIHSSSNCETIPKKFL